MSSGGIVLDMLKKYSVLSNLELPWNKFRKSNILITGGNGLIASNLVDAFVYLQKKFLLHMNLYVLCRSAEKAKKRFDSYLGEESFHLIIQDVCDPLMFDVDFQYIIHAASSAHPQAFNTVPVDVMRANFLGTLNLLNYTLKYTDTRFMFVSSSEVYGENFEGIDVFQEDMSGNVDYTKFRSCYPESKRASETLCMCFSKQYHSDIVIVRPAFIYGKDIIDSNTRADVYFLRQVLEHKDIIMYSEGTQIRSYCYIKDCISAMLYALLLGGSGEIYNIGNQNCVVSLKEYAATLAKLGGVSLKYEPQAAPKGVVFLKTTRCVLSTEKLEKLGWKALYTLEAGITDMLK